jgi:hypothetical protein
MLLRNVGNDLRDYTVSVPKDSNPCSSLADEFLAFVIQGSLSEAALHERSFTMS